jgi:hypothetical protein
MVSMYNIKLWNELSRCACAELNSIKKSAMQDLSVGIMVYQGLNCENGHDGMMSFGRRD